MAKTPVVKHDSAPVDPPAEVEPPAPNPDNVVVHWLNALSPLLIGQWIDCQAYAEASGLNIYYVAANIDELQQVDAKTNKPVYLRSASIVKVVKNILGEAIIKVNDPIAEFDSLKEYAHFSLPKMPLEMVLKLDQFFRKVDEVKHTEAIVLLTYDPTIGGSDGWGVLVPKQRNTAGSCDYEPLSVVDDQPDNAHIVGSAHSHPGMSAFASHTDIGDQASFDGLHITFGWTDNIKTEYYLELQMGGSRFTLEPEQVFCAPSLPEVDTEHLDGWMDKVEKGGYDGYGAGGYGYGYASGAWGDAGYNGYNSYSSGANKITPPKGCPDIEKNIVITNFKNGYESTCPICSRVLSSYNREDRRCGHCMCYVVEVGETVEDLIAIREEKKADGSAAIGAGHLRFANKPVYFWHREEQNSTVNTTIECLFSPRVKTTTPPKWIDPRHIEALAKEQDKQETDSAKKVERQLDDSTPFMLAQAVPVYVRDEWDDDLGHMPFHQGRVCLFCGTAEFGAQDSCPNPSCDAYRDYSRGTLVPTWWALPDRVDRQVDLGDLYHRCVLCDTPLDDQDHCSKCGPAAQQANTQIDAFGLDDLDVYEVDHGICGMCTHYYETTCPMLRSALRAFHQRGAQFAYDTQDLTHSIHGCPGYSLDVRYIDEVDEYDFDTLPY